jgi:hypothetical protein
VLCLVAAGVVALPSPARATNSIEDAVAVPWGGGFVNTISVEPGSAGPI